MQEYFYLLTLALTLTALFLKLSVLMVTHHFTLYLEKSKWGTWTCSIILQNSSVMPFCKYKKISRFAIAQLYGLIICGLRLVICVFICPFIDVLYVHMYIRITNEINRSCWLGGCIFLCSVFVIGNCVHYGPWFHNNKCEGWLLTYREERQGKEDVGRRKLCFALIKEALGSEEGNF